MTQSNQDKPRLTADFSGSRLEALVEMMFHAAASDGEVGDDELASLLENLQTLSDMKLAADELSATFRKIEAATKAEGRAARLADVRARLESPAIRRAAFELVIHVVSADGVIRTSERELLLEVAEALEIDPDQAANLVRRGSPP